MAGMFCAREKFVMIMDNLGGMTAVVYVHVRQEEMLNVGGIVSEVLLS